MDIVAKAKSIPPVVWLIGGAAVVALVLLKGGGGGGSSGVVPPVGAGAGGEGSDTLDSLSQGFVDLVEETRAQRALDLEWQKGIEAIVKGGGVVKTPTTTTKATTHWGTDISKTITSRISSDSVAAAMRKAGVSSWGVTINYSDLKKALTKEGINYGSVVDLKDLDALFKKTGVKPTAPTPAPQPPATA